MRTTMRIILLAVAAIIITGCNMFNKTPSLTNRDKQYLSAKNYPSLRIPPGVSSRMFKNKYPIPRRNYADGAKEISIVPPGLNS